MKTQYIKFVMVFALFFFCNTTSAELLFDCKPVKEVTMIGEPVIIKMSIENNSTDVVELNLCKEKRERELLCRENCYVNIEHLNTGQHQSFPIKIEGVLNFPGDSYFAKEPILQFYGMTVKRKYIILDEFVRLRQGGTYKITFFIGKEKFNCETKFEIIEADAVLMRDSFNSILKKVGSGSPIGNWRVLSLYSADEVYKDQMKMWAKLDPLWRFYIFSSFLLNPNDEKLSFIDNVVFQQSTFTFMSYACRLIEYYITILPESQRVKIVDYYPDFCMTGNLLRTSTSLMIPIFPNPKP